MKKSLYFIMIAGLAAVSPTFIEAAASATAVAPSPAALPAAAAGAGTAATGAVFRGAPAAPPVTKTTATTPQVAAISTAVLAIANAEKLQRLLKLSPYVLHWIEDWNQLPTNIQIVQIGNNWTSRRIRYAFSNAPKKLIEPIVDHNFRELHIIHNGHLCIAVQRINGDIELPQNPLIFVQATSLSRKIFTGTVIVGTAGLLTYIGNPELARQLWNNPRSTVTEGFAQLRGIRKLEAPVSS